MGDLSKNFSRREFACKCFCGKDTVDAELILVLEEARLFFRNRSVIITSGVRCELHNQEVGGSPKSLHLQGKAADIIVKGINSEIVHDHLYKKYPGKYGIGRYSGRTHIDVRPGEARWSGRNVG